MVEFTEKEAALLKKCVEYQREMIRLLEFENHILELLAEATLESSGSGLLSGNDVRRALDTLEDARSKGSKS